METYVLKKEMIKNQFVCNSQTTLITFSDNLLPLSDVSSNWSFWP